MKQIYTCKSKIHGLGIRIGEDVKKGDFIFYVKGKMKFKVNKNKADALANPDWIGVAANQWIDPKKPYKFLNHSCDPTTGIRGRVTLVALKDLKQGDEITIDYSTIEGDPQWEMKCLCGSKKCRGIVRSIQSLPKRRFEEYLPYVSTYFKKLYLKTKV